MGQGPDTSGYDIMRSRCSLTLQCVFVIGIFTVMGLGITYTTNDDNFTIHDVHFTTRAFNIPETEPNGWGTGGQGDFSNADILNKDNGLLNLSGTMADKNDIDCFQIDLEAGTDQVDNLTIQPTHLDSDSGTIFIIWIYSQYPRDSQSDSNIIASEYWWSHTSKDIAWFHAAYTGTYYFMISVYSGTNWEYHLNVNVTPVAPTDTYNSMDDALNITGPRLMERLSFQNDYDHMDWFRVPMEDNFWPTKMSMSVEVDSSKSGTYSGRDIVVELRIWIAYLDKADALYKVVESTPGRPHYGISLDDIEDPIGTDLNDNITINFEYNCTELYVGFDIETWTQLTGDNARAVVDSPHSKAWAYYNITNFSAVSLIPNDRPILLNGTVSPEEGRTTDTYVYEVTYVDLDNDPPEFVKLTYDGNIVNMTKKDGEGDDYTQGVTYEYSIAGDVLGEVPHTYWFGAADHEYVAEGDRYTHNGPIVDNNRKPYIKPSPPNLVELTEDQEPFYINLTKIFADDDGEGTLDFNVRSTGAWGKTLETDLSKYTVNMVNKTLKIDPLENQFGTDVVSVNASDGKAFILLPGDLTVNITEVNDPPVFSKVGGKTPVLGKVNLEATEGTWFELKLIASDPIDEDEINFSTNIDNVLVDADEYNNYNFNPETGDLNFIPSDADVTGDFILNVTVTDSRGASATVQAVFEIINVNGPPEMDDPGDFEVEQYQWVEIDLEAVDQDMDSGDSITFFTNIRSKIKGFWDDDNYFFDEVNGTIRLHANAQEMVGVYDITAGARDSNGGNHTINFTLEIINVNDPPIAKPIAITAGGHKDLNVTLTTTKASDLDGDRLTYVWDFGDGAPSEEGRDFLTVKHEYAGPGEFNVTLTISDGELDDVRFLVITVTAPDPKPPVVVDDDDDNYTEPSQAWKDNGQDTTDSDNDGIYDWWELNNGLDPNTPGDADQTKQDAFNDEKENYEKWLVDNPPEPIKGDDDARSGFAWWWILIVILILLVLLVIIVLVMRKRKKEEEVDEEALLEPSFVEPSAEDDGLLEPEFIQEPAQSYEMPMASEPVLDGMPPAAEMAPLPEVDEPLGLPPAGGTQTHSKEEKLDDLFGDMEDKTRKKRVKKEPETRTKPLPVEESTHDAELDDIFSDIGTTGSSGEDERIGQTLDVACHSCGEMMEIEVTQIPMSIACWNCGTEGVIE